MVCGEICKEIPKNIPGEKNPEPERIPDGIIGDKMWNISRHP